MGLPLHRATTATTTGDKSMFLRTDLFLRDSGHVVLLLLSPNTLMQARAALLKDLRMLGLNLNSHRPVDPVLPKRAHRLTAARKKTETPSFQGLPL